MIYSPKCNNPSKGFRNENGSQVANAGQGYPVLDEREMYEAYHNPKWYKKLKRMQDEI